MFYHNFRFSRAVIPKLSPIKPIRNFPLDISQFSPKPERRRRRRRRRKSNLLNCFEACKLALTAMVPFQAQLSPIDKRAAVPVPENFAKKRKWEEPQKEITYTKKVEEAAKSILDIELHLETPLPLDWQRCLDIQSGQIHFYNTTTQKRTSRDPRDNLDDDEEEMSLDLELNLTCESLDKNINNQTQSNNLFGLSEINHNKLHRVGDHQIKRSPSWLACDGHQQEMVAAVCMRCHLLVMLCKSSPECPNCKFMHSPEQTPPTSLFKRRCSLSW